MKKITCVLIVMVLVAALVGCTNVDKNNTAATPSAAPMESVAPTAAATVTAETTVMPELVPSPTNAATETPAGSAKATETVIPNSTGTAGK